MKLTRTSLTIAAIGLTSFAALTAGQGCSSSSGSPATENPDSGKPGTDSGKPSTDSGKPGTDSGKPGTDSGKPGKDSGSDKTDAGRPPQPTGSPTTSTTKHNFAVHNLYFGDTLPTPAFTPPPTGGTPPWETFGYNIDGLITTATSTDVCTPYMGMTQAQVDGKNGIDNAFGSVLFPSLQELSSTIGSQSLSGDVAAGKFTLMFDTVGLSTTQPQTAINLTGSLFAGSTYGATPPLTGTSFSITDDWPVNGSLLVNPTDITSGSKILFGNSYITNGTWVSGQQTGSSAGSIVLALSIMGYNLNLTINDPVVTMPVSVDGSGQFHATEGFVSGVIETSQLVASLNGILAGIGLCSAEGDAIQILDEAQDILIASDGTVSNTAGTACNGISIGLAFDADEIAQPDMIAPVADAGGVTPPTCGDAGM